MSAKWYPPVCGRDVNQSKDYNMYHLCIKISMSIFVSSLEAVNIFIMRKTGEQLAHSGYQRTISTFNFYVESYIKFFGLTNIRRKIYCSNNSTNIIIPPFHYKCTDKMT